MGAFGMMWGPWDTCAHLFSKERLTFTATYFGSLGATLYFAMGMQSTILTTIAASFQVRFEIHIMPLVFQLLKTNKFYCLLGGFVGKIID